MTTIVEWAPIKLAAVEMPRGNGQSDLQLYTEDHRRVRAVKKEIDLAAIPVWLDDETATYFDRAGEMAAERRAQHTLFPFSIRYPVGIVGVVQDFTQPISQTVYLTRQRLIVGDGIHRTG